MAKKTINQALKDLFLGLGGDPSKLSDNTSVSDYIEDLESAIEAAATAELPTPAETNVGKVATVVENEGSYSWGAEEVVIPQELPTPASTNVGKVATVVSDGEGGYEWSAETPSGLPAVTASDNEKILGVSNGAWAKSTRVHTVSSMKPSGSSITIGSGVADFEALKSICKQNNTVAVIWSQTDGMTPASEQNRLLFTAKRVDASNNTYLIFTGVICDMDNDTLYNATAIFKDSLTGTFTKTAIT